MNILLDDLPYNAALFPFAEIKSAAHIRLGILTLFEKWNLVFPGQVFVASENSKFQKDKDTRCFPANLLPSFEDLHQLKKDGDAEALLKNSRVIARPWQLFQWNDFAIREDFTELTRGKKSQPVPEGSRAIAPGNIFIAEGATVLLSVINAENGPVYIGENALVMEGSLLRGPLAVCHGSVVKMGTKIYGATTIGPMCTVGGEVKNSILMDYSNKAHDGYLGDSVIGEWCNLGAGTCNSNIKNNASTVQVWANATGKFEDAGLKCGLLMGSYSKAAINTSFNTGTVVGCCCNIFAKETPPKLVENFSWGSGRYEWEKVVPHIENWKKLRGEQVAEQEEHALKALYNKNK